MIYRSEGVALRPFTGLEELEEILFSNVRLKITTAEKTDTIPPGAAYAFDKEELLRCGLSLEVVDPDRILKTASPLAQSDADLDYVVIAEDGVRSGLRGIQIVAQGRLGDLPQSLEIAKAKEVNSGLVLGHPHASRILSIYVVHNKNIWTTSATVPRKKGAILGKASFDLLVQPANEALQPLKLDDEHRTDFGISKNAWFYFQPLEEIMESETLQGAFNFYVDEEMLNFYSGAAKEHRQFFELQLFSLVLTNLIQIASRRIREEEESGGYKPSNSAAIVRLFNSIYSGLSGYKRDWPTKFLDNPQAAISEAIAVGGSAGTLVALLRQELDDE